MSKIVKIKPLTHKMKNRVKEHGETWKIEAEDGSRRYKITPEHPVNPDFPYSTWIIDGIDARVERFS